MKKLLIVDDDSAMRGLLRKRLSDAYEIHDTGSPEQAVALALEHKPDAILLDLMMPKFSGFELCQGLHSLSYTSAVPIFVITGESGLKYKDHCAHLGATAYFEKPVDFTRLKERLATELEGSRPERRSEVRVRMRIALKLRGMDIEGKRFEDLAETDNVSAHGFLCNCPRTLLKGEVLEVFMAGGTERYVGRARVVRKEAPGAPWQRYGFHFEDETIEWVLQKGVSRS
jgi:DNA-binding response OmpR family regulator